MDKETVEKILYGFVLLGLVIEAIADIRRKRIYLVVVMVELPVLIGVRYLIGDGGIMLWIASLGVGAVFYLMSMLTKEQIGKGDSFVVCMTGAGIGLLNNLLLIYVTFVLAFLAAVFLLLVKKVNKKYAMPLTPFVLAAYLIVIGSQAFT